MPQPEIIGTAEAARLLKVSRRRVNALITSGRLPTTQIGTTHMIRREDLKLVRRRKPGRPPAE